MHEMEGWPANDISFSDSFFIPTNRLKAGTELKCVGCVEEAPLRLTILTCLELPPVWSPKEIVSHIPVPLAPLSPAIYSFAPEFQEIWSSQCVCPWRLDQFSGKGENTKRNPLSFALVSNHTLHPGRVYGTALS